MKRLLLVFAALCLIGGPSYYLATSILTSGNDVHITATVPEQSVTQEASASNEDSSSSTQLFDQEDALLNVAGYSAPNALIYFFVDGQQAKTWIANQEGYFEDSYWVEQEGNRVFSFVAEVEGTRSTTLTYSLDVEEGKIYDLTSIYLHPTVSTSSHEVLHGSAISGSVVTVVINNQAATSYIVEDSGKFSIPLNVIEEESAVYVTCTYESQSCGKSPVVTVSNETVLPALLGDFNRDGQVNYVDFGLIHKAYQSKSYQAVMDLNQDNTLDLADFSILAYQWSL